MLAGAAVLLLLVALLGDEDRGESGKLTGSSGNAFKLSYPASWRPLSSEELGRLPGKPLAVVRRDDGKGFVIVRREKRAPKSFEAFSADLTDALDRRVPDFQKRTSRIVRLGGERAFFYSYIRKRRGTVHTVVLVPARERSYVLNTISTGGAERVARQIARMILSFKAG